MKKFLSSKKRSDFEIASKLKLCTFFTLKNTKYFNKIKTNQIQKVFFQDLSQFVSFQTSYVLFTEVLSLCILCFLRIKKIKLIRKKEIFKKNLVFLEIFFYTFFKLLKSVNF